MERVTKKARELRRGDLVILPDGMRLRVRGCGWSGEEGDTILVHGESARGQAGYAMTSETDIVVLV
jgi:hypothetical protein